MSMVQTTDKGAVAIRWSSNNATALFTSRTAGHLGHLPPRGLHDDSCCGQRANERRQQIWGGSWVSCAQVHGNKVVAVDSQTPKPTIGLGSSEADALVTSAHEVGLAIATADCGPVALFSDECIGAAHAGWRGLQAGVIKNTVGEMRQLGAKNIAVALGPSICPSCYEFDNPELLGEFVDKWGPQVIGVSRRNTPSFNLRAAIVEECRQLGVAVVKGEHASEIPCTSCSGNFFSYRARKDSGRQVLLIWRHGEHVGAK